VNFVLMLLQGRLSSPPIKQSTRPQPRPNSTSDVALKIKPSLRLSLNSQGSVMGSYQNGVAGGKQSVAGGEQSVAGGEQSAAVVDKGVDFAQYFCTYAFLYHQKEMLSDRVRMDAYYNAIFKNKHHFQGKVSLSLSLSLSVSVCFWVGTRERLKLCRCFNVGKQRQTG
jgi:hypothetical protein